MRKYPVELYAYVLMSNHWRIVLRPIVDGGMGRLLRWGTSTFPQLHHAHYDTSGKGHLYQARFKSFPIEDDDHLLVVCRYVERNPSRAALVTGAEAWKSWKYCSLWECLHRPKPENALLSAWRIPRTLTTGLNESIRRLATRGVGGPFLRGTWMSIRKRCLGLGNCQSCRFGLHSLRSWASTKSAKRIELTPYPFLLAPFLLGGEGVR
jgi:putative transposase